MTRTKILYIAGWGRSGTTVLDNLLGQVDGFVSTGELHQIWSRGLTQGRSCGCGVTLTECPFWQQVFQAGFGGIGNVDAAQVIRSQDAIHTRHAPRVLRSAQSGSLMQSFQYATHLNNLYSGLASVDGTRVIVDSSKYPTDAIVAAGLPDFDAFVVHVYRDPRAVAFSWRRIKETPDKRTDGGKLRRVGVVRSTIVWQVYNWVIARYVRRSVGSHNFMGLAYEDLASRPEAALDSIIDLLRENPSQRPTFQDNVVEVKPSHTASGNPNRFESGRREIRLDSEWERRLSPWRKGLVSVLALPMLSRLGYRLKA